MTQIKPDLNIKELETLITSGRGIEVKRILLKTEFAGIANLNRISLAHIARRIGLPNLALKILSPIIRNEIRLEKADPEILLAFGAALVGVGVNKWGNSILQTLDERAFPQSLLFRAFSHFNQWQSEPAEVLLKSFIAIDSISPYDKMIGELNLASALVGVAKFGEAEVLIQKLSLSAKANNRKVIYGSCFELLGQIRLQQNDLKQASIQFSKAVEILEAAHGLPSLWARKWLAISHLLIDPKSQQPLLKVRTEAASVNDFETIRECDLFFAKVLKDEELFAKVYFGTSFSGYRKRMHQLIGEASWPNIAENYKYKFTNQTKSFLDIYEGTLDTNIPVLEFGQQAHLLCFHLASDLYKPFSIANIFSHLFPKEIYDPFTSPARVNRAVFRLRKLFSERKMDLKVRVLKGHFFLEGKMTGLHFREKIESDLSVDLFFDKMRKKFETIEFTTREVAKLFNLEIRVAQRKIKTLRESGLVDSFGVGSNAVYWIIKGK